MTDVLLEGQRDIVLQLQSRCRPENVKMLRDCMVAVVSRTRIAFFILHCFIIYTKNVTVGFFVVLAIFCFISLCFSISPYVSVAHSVNILSGIPSSTLIHSTNTFMLLSGRIFHILSFPERGKHKEYFETKD